MYIKKIMLENFQSHKNTEIDFSDGYNCIVGRNDSGKTSVLRALSIILYNQPRGADMFIRHGTKSFKVEIELDSGVRVARIKGKIGSKTVNKYVITMANGQEIPFENVENTVPEDVSDVLKLRSLVIGDMTYQINYRKQKESPFLLLDPDSTKAKILSNISGNDAVDLAIQDKNKDLGGIKKEQKFLSDELESLKLQIDEYKDMDIIKEKLSELKSLIDKILQAKEKYDVLYALNNTYKDIIEDKKILLRKKELFKNLDFEIMEKIVENFNKYKVMFNLCDNYNSVIEDRDGLLKKKELFKSIDLKVMDILIDKYNQYKVLRGLADRFLLIKDDLSVLKSKSEKMKVVDFSIMDIIISSYEKLNKIKLVKEMFDKTREELEFLELKKSEIIEDCNAVVNEYIDMLKKSKKCPTCFSDITEKSVDNIIEQFK